MENNKPIYIMGGLLALIFIVGIAISIVAHNVVTTATVIVSDKERVTSTTVVDGKTTVSSKYLVFTDVETFEVTDSILMFRWNSSDVYGSLVDGECYEVVARGFRVPLLSMYKNIDTATPCK